MVDVGAHQRASLSCFAENGWQVIAFEPDPDNRNILKDNYDHYDNVLIDQRACSNTNQLDAVFFTSEESSGVSALSPFLDSHKPSYSVQVATLGNALAELNPSNKTIDFLKIDTEGHDLFVLKGFPWDKLSPPRTILCEFEDSKTNPLGYQFHDLAAFLMDKGYRLIISEWHPVKSYGGSHKWRRFATYPVDLKDPDGWGNIIAVQDKKSFDHLRTFCKIN